MINADDSRQLFLNNSPVTPEGELLPSFGFQSFRLKIDPIGVGSIVGWRDCAATYERLTAASRNRI